MPVACIICVLTFAGAGGLRVWMHSADSPQAGQETVKSAAETGKGGQVSVLGNPITSLPGDPAADGAAVRALAGLTPGAMVSVEEVFAAGGLTRRLRLGLFLTNASPADLKTYLDRCTRENLYDVKMTDPAWQRWTELDPHGAVAESGSGGAAWWAWGKTDPAAALAAAAKDGRASLQAVARAIAQTDPEAGRRVLEEYPEADSTTVQEGLVNGLQRTDPAAAAALALEKGADLEDAVEHWMQKDQAAALDWAERIANPAQRRNVQRIALKELALTDPARAFAEAEKLPPGNMRADVAAEAIGALALRDPAAAQQAAEAIPPSAARQQALAALAVSLAGTETGKAAALETLRQISWTDLNNSWGFKFKTGSEVLDTNSEHDRTNPVFTTVQKLMSTAPEETANILAADPQLNAPVQMATDMWLKRDPEGASRWASALPPGEAKDHAVMAITGWLAFNGPEPDFEAAAAWSLAFSHEVEQAGTLRDVFQQWKKADPHGARAAADRMELNDTLRAAVENSLR